MAFLCCVQQVRNAVYPIIHNKLTVTGWKLPLEQSAARHHLSSSADCFFNRLKTYLFSWSFLSKLFLISSSAYRV